MTDFASLAMKVDSSDVAKGVKELDNLAAAGGRAEASVNKVGTSAREAAAGAQAMAAATSRTNAVVREAASVHKAAASATSLSRIQMMEMSHVATALADSMAAGINPAKALFMESGRIAQVMSFSSGGVRGFVASLADMLGIMKTVGDAEATANAQAAAGAAAALEARVASAQGAIAAADTELALAVAQQRVAVTEAEATAASEALAAAHVQVAEAATAATIAESAFAEAAVAAGEAAAAASAAEVTAMTPVLPIILTIAAAVGTVIGAFELFKHQVDDSEALTNYAKSLGLTHNEMKKLGDDSITFGDAMSGVWKTIADHTGADKGIKEFKEFIVDAFKQVLEAGLDIFADLYGAIVGTYRASIIIWQNFPAAISDVFVSGVNLALTAINKLASGSADIVNGFIHKVNSTFGSHFADVAAGQIDLMANANAGKAKLVMNAFKTETDKATKEALDGAHRVVKEVEDNILGAAEKRLKAKADEIIADRTAKKPKKKSDTLALELEANEALIKGNYALAAAYQVSDAAAFRQEVTTKATAEAIKKKADIESYVAQQMRLAVSQRAVDGAKEINNLQATTEAQKKVNDAVAAGTLTASQANKELQQEAALRPLLAAYANAEGDAKTALGKIIQGVRDAQKGANDETERAQVLAASASADDKLAQLKSEAELINATNRERAVAIAQMQAEQYLRDHPGASTTEAAAYIDKQKQIAGASVDLQNAKSDAELFQEALQAVAEQAGVTGQALSDAFGNVGNVLGTAISGMADYAAQSHSLAMAVKNNTMSQQDAEKKLATLRDKNTLGAISGLKSLFKTHSAGYKVMQAVEMAYSIFKTATTIAAMVQDATHTASSVANSTTRAAADQAAGASKIFSQLGWLAFPVVGAMIALLASLGLKGGGGGGSTAVAPPSAEDLQKSAGTGTVLGDASAKSASIANSLQIVASNTNKDLEYSNQMLRALHSIDNSISKMAGTVAQQIKVAGSMFDTSGLNLGSTGSGGFLGIGAKSTTRSLYDLGLNLQSSTVADIIAKGVVGSTYQTVEQVKKKSGFLGIGGGTSTSYQTTTGQIDPAIESAIQDVVGGLRQGVLAAANVLGINGADAIVDKLKIALGKISFKDMTGQQIEDQLNAIFSNVGDKMAAAIAPSLASLQKVGEGLFETLSRVAREYQVVDIELKSIGKTFGAVGLSSLAARDALVQLFGSMDEFVSETDFFHDNFLSTAEQIAPVQKAVIDQMKALGLAGVTTREQFKNVVLGLNLSTTAGQETYAALMAVAPAFDKVLNYYQDANKAQLDALKATADQFDKFTDTLTKYRATLYAADTATAAGYATLKRQFAATAALAATGNADALGSLSDAGKNFLTSAKNNASSLLDYQRDVATVAQGVDKGIFASESVADYARLQYDAQQNAVSILGVIAANTASTASALGGNAAVATGAGVATPAAVTTPAAATGQTITVVNDADLTAELEGLRADMKAALQAIAANTGSMDRRQARYDRGDSMAITADSDSPLPVNLSSWGG